MYQLNSMMSHLPVRHNQVKVSRCVCVTLIAMTWLPHVAELSFAQLSNPTCTTNSKFCHMTH